MGIWGFPCVDYGPCCPEHSREREIEEYLERLGDVWRKNPNLSLGQMVVAAAGREDPFYVWDEELLAGMEEL